MERVCRLENKIYRELLCITRFEGRTIITIVGLFRSQLNLFSPTQNRILLSWDLLSWISLEGRIPDPFTNFITTPELSGPLYIRPDIYHSQITEYSLQTIYEWALFSLCIEHLPNCCSVRPCGYSDVRDQSFREHLSHALPTEHIFFLLRSIRSEYVIRTSEYSAELMLEIIIIWLQVRVGECNWQTLRLKIRFVSRDLVQSDRRTCTIVFRVNFFDTKLNFDFEAWDLIVSPATSCCNQM
jgi:hypothetical protein